MDKRIIRCILAVFMLAVSALILTLINTRTILGGFYIDFIVVSANVIVMYFLLKDTVKNWWQEIDDDKK